MPPRSLTVARPHRLCRRPKLRLLTDDLPRETLKILARSEAEIVVEVAPRPLVDFEGLGVATRAIERDHELGEKALAVRRFFDQPAQLSYELGMAAKGQIGVDADLERPRAKLVQALGLRATVRMQRHPGEDRAVPEVECLLRNGRGSRMVTGGQGLACVVYEILEVCSECGKIPKLSGLDGFSADDRRAKDMGRSY